MKLNVLFITRYMGSFIEKSTYYLGEELKKHCHLTYWYEDGNLPDIVSQQPRRPDFILFNDQKPDYCPWIRNIDKVEIPKGTLVHDMHYRIGRRKKLYKKNQIEHLFVQYRDAFFKWYPEYKQQMIWLPHHVPGHIFKDMKLKKDLNLLMAGSLIDHLYPLRVKIYNEFSRRSDFTYIQHPGYRNIHSQSKYIIGDRYARLLNRSRIFLTCDSIYKFPVLKYFEAACCGSLLLASGSSELQDLGFIDGETYVEVNENNFHEKAMYYLHNDKERQRIAANGIKLVKQKHTTEIRAKQLLKHIERIVRKGG